MKRQPMDRRLVILFLLWITVLTLGQVAFITYYFTARQYTPPQNRSDTPQDKSGQPANIKQTSHSLYGKMLNFDASIGKGKIQHMTWKSLGDETIVQTNGQLTVKEYGYYFLYLQVTLQNEEVSETHVSLSVSGKVFLSSRVMPLTRSTGLLGKARLLSRNETLEVTIHPPAKVNDTSVTYLGIIYLPLQPQ